MSTAVCILVKYWPISCGQQYTYYCEKWSDTGRLQPCSQIKCRIPVYSRLHITKILSNTVQRYISHQTACFPHGYNPLTHGGGAFQRHASRCTIILPERIGRLKLIPRGKINNTTKKKKSCPFKQTFYFIFARGVLPPSTIPHI